MENPLSVWYIITFRIRNSCTCCSFLVNSQCHISCCVALLKRFRWPAVLSYNVQNFQKQNFLFKMRRSFLFGCNEKNLNCESESERQTSTQRFYIIWFSCCDMYAWTYSSFNVIEIVIAVDFCLECIKKNTVVFHIYSVKRKFDLGMTHTNIQNTLYIMYFVSWCICMRMVGV